MDDSLRLALLCQPRSVDSGEPDKWGRMPLSVARPRAQEAPDGTYQLAGPPPFYHWSLAQALHLDAQTLVTCLYLLVLCRVAVQGS
jgi:hypothetical protein